MTGRKLVAGTMTLAGIVLFALVAFGGSTKAAAANDPVWVNDLAYGSKGGGFYHDFTSGLDWTAERGWHQFSPQPPRASYPPMWTNYITYGSASQGFYLDPLSGQVWTSERGWHLFAPASAAVTFATPTRTPTLRPPTATPIPAPSGGRTGAVCRDGWRSSATGSGACSHHGGVAYWTY